MKSQEQRVESKDDLTYSKGLLKWQWNGGDELVILGSFELLSLGIPFSFGLGTLRRSGAVPGSLCFCVTVTISTRGVLLGHWKLAEQGTTLLRLRFFLHARRELHPALEVCRGTLPPLTAGTSLLLVLGTPSGSGSGICFIVDASLSFLL